MTRDAWVAAHPYLLPVAEVHAAVEDAATAIGIRPAPLPDFEAYAADFHDGVPLLQSPGAAIDLAPVDAATDELIRKLASAPGPGTLPRQCRELLGDPAAPSNPGLYRYLGCAVLVRYLAPTVGAFDAWRTEDRWLRNYCPTCGDPPAMAQLVGKDPGRLRKLSCGGCRTRWRYRRTGCPFCDLQDKDRLAVYSVAGEGGLRIDYCEVCGGYLKTYDGEGSESVLLADWTSVHLDFVARDRGLKRKAASLYDLGI